MKKLILNLAEPSQIKILSAHLQDAIIRIDDMAFLKPQNRFIAVANRFCWEQQNQNCRILSGFHFDSVQKIAYRGFDRNQTNQFAHLLAICFNETELPAGIIRLIFTDNNQVKLNVEAVQIYLQDIEECWQVECRPEHPETDE